MKIKTLFAIVALCGTTLCSLHAQTPYVTDGNTVLLYHLDEGANAMTAVDSSGYGRNATYDMGEDVQRGLPSISSLMGNAIRPASGVYVGRTYYTDTTTVDDQGQDSVLYQTAAGDFTVEMWLKFDSLDFTGSVSLFTIQTEQFTGVNIDMSLTIIGSGSPFQGALALGDSNGANRAFMVGGYEWGIDTWYHVAVTVQKNGDGNSEVLFYINQAGASTTPSPVASWTIADLVLNSSDERRAVEIGNYFGNGGESFFPGMIDEVRYSNIVRTEFDTLAVPEPSTVAILGLGLGVILMRLSRRK